MPFLISLFLLIQISAASAQFATYSPPDLSGYAKSSDVPSSIKQASIPASGPGAGICKETVVPGNLVTSGGVTGTAGTCSLIVQCGTSATYIVKQFNVGSGC